MSGVIDFLHNIAKRLPSIKAPEKPPTTKERLIWTGAALILFFVMYHVTAFGIEEETGAMDFLQTITASKIGSLLTTGIGPIVLASIFLQLFIGAGLIKLDMHDRANRQKFHEVQKILAIVLAVIEAAIFVFGGRVLLTGILGPLTAPLVILQITLGSVILLYLDEIITKYGIGSGISLFIAAGVSLSIINGSIALIFYPGGLLDVIAGGEAEAIPKAIITLMPFVFTVAVFLTVVYAEGVKVEVPIAFERIKGFAPKLPLKYFYVSNIPVIFASALLVNISLLAVAITPQVSPTGEYQLTDYLWGVFYLLTPVYGAGRGTLAHLEFLTHQTTPIFGLPEWVHAITYVLFLSLVSVLFGLFWVETANMDAKSVANQLSQSGLQIPGFRKDPRMLESILNRYILPLTVLGSFSVGLLAGLADLTGALGTGTGILLTVGILYRMYEQMEQMKMFELYPTLGRIVGE